LDQACNSKGTTVRALAGHFVEVCPTQAAPRPQKRESFQNIGFAGTIGAKQTHRTIACLKIKPWMVSKLG
jgi:hypothetical protein